MSKLKKTRGSVRGIDDLGRIVIPCDIRRRLGINIQDKVEIFSDNNQIILRKYADSCIFCDSTKNLMNYMGKTVCSACYENIKNGVVDSEDESDSDSED
ncbi:MAG: AbrB/MazE/SpoVT family DNA-binding domain-containing protein [Oscillospiraceae bacterium]|nr:AbrB/MazE/SpoVT family DNA-binding domain-containing protein [Oscillospiraceae bacterium]